uniref:Complement C1q-like protein 2 n=1 Tax=Magallana gigas TaxID=29159 RepID=K1QZD8_MAGGI
MYLRNALRCIILQILVVIKVQGNAVNLTDVIHGFPGHTVDPADMMQTMQIMTQMLVNQTAEIEHLKQQTAKIENLIQQTEKDRSTIQTLQNRVFFLESEQNELSKLPSSQEFATYLSGINHLTQNLLTNEAIDRNLTRRFNDVFEAVEGLKINESTTSQQVRNQSIELDILRQQSEKDRLTIQQLNRSLINAIRDVNDLITNKSNHHAFTAGISSTDDGWTGDTLVFPTVIYSVGTGYNPITGIFTAPTAGTYVFYVSVESAHHQLIYVDIVMNGSSKVRAMAWYGGGSSISVYQTGTNLVILHLQTGDRVWVRRGGGAGYYSDSDHITTFSGFKLY